MSIVTFFVETADGFLEDAASTQFGAVSATVGTLIIVASTLVIIFVFINMIYQMKPMDAGTAFWLAVKLVLVSVFATDWLQFSSLSYAVLNGIDTFAGALISSVGGGEMGPSGTFAEEFDAIILEFGNVMNAIGSKLSWMAGALLSVVGVILLSFLGGIAAFFLVASRLMIALLLSLAPIMIFLTLFDVTKDYFTRWLSSLVSFAIYPVIIAGVFATIIGVSNSLISSLGNPDDATNIGAVIPFVMMIFMAKGFIFATPILTRSISGNIIMPALSSGLGGAYDFGRGVTGNQQAKNRENMGTASFGERIGLNANRALSRKNAPTKNDADTKHQPTGTGAQQHRLKERADRLSKK